MGANRAYDATNSLIRDGANYLISFGVAAALHNSLQPGDILLPEKLIDYRGNTQKLNDPSQLKGRLLSHVKCKKRPGIFSKNLAEINEFLDTPESKQQLHQSSGAWAADMESGAIFRATSEHQLPMNIIRVISDDVHQSIPGTVKNHLNKYGQPLFPGFYLGLVFSPIEIISLVQLGLGFRRARRSLTLFSELIN